MAQWRHIVCIASGPSLTIDDCNTVKVWSDSSPERGVVVVNSTFRLCPWASVLFAMDNAWWRGNGREVSKSFEGIKYSRYGAHNTFKTPAHHGNNSGAGAILLAHKLGAQRITLLGYDCQATGGKIHWHEDHSFPMANCDSMPQWARYFSEAAGMIGDTPVINASRETALTIWPRQALEDALSE